MHSVKKLYKIGKGPSSSHTMGPERAAKDFLNLCPEAARYCVTLFGSLALTGKGHLTDVAIRDVFAGKEIEIVFDSLNHDLPHPNTMQIVAYNELGKTLLSRIYLSVGGGSVRVLGEPVPKSEEIYPFRNFTEIKQYCLSEKLSLDEMVFQFEGEQIKEYFREVWHTMRATIARGLQAEGELPGGLHVKRKAAILAKDVVGELPEEREKRVICSYAFAVAEENAGGGTVVTAPTCGACGVLPAVLYYLAERYHLPDETVFSALAVAGIIGNVVKTNASISGAEAGCQAEIGTATAMAAAAVCRIYGYSLEETEYAAEISLEHQLGLTCDPILGLVQIPCIERNVVAAMRALESAELAHILNGTRKISFDLIVKTMYKTGKDLNARYRETAEGGLAAEYRDGDE